MKERIVIGAYMVIGALNITAQLIDSPQLNQTSKILLVPTLIYLVFVMAQGMVTLPRLLLAVGLTFSWAGDILLLFPDEEVYFLGGLGMFLVAQILYTIVMYKSAYSKPRVNVRQLGPILLYGVILFYFVLPNTGNLVWPIIAYAACILGMVSMARFRQGKTSDESYELALIGAALFVLSDSLIALDKFVIDIPLSTFWIMSTYIVAQYLIVKGVMSHPGG
ncbi:MAG: lysoplasmalogenase [Marinoscillum sp.]|uniref:lysoplasmalogenase n=1 Tax=Marinoscillum sp. TaxID=2024838 RepID=UPI0032F2A74C